MILNKFPNPQEFYKTYWGKKPFIVRAFISPNEIETYIDGDTLAGLSLEEDIKSRIITNNNEGNDWVCEHGPFEDDRYDDIGDKNWSLLVQNVEQYHKETANLLPHFQFSPRWLLDDIMVSFSSAGGSVGPHTDSYHTFLVQGMGKRTWKISADKINDNCYVDNADMKVLQNGFDGEVYEVTAGDIIYMPPFFGHEGTTIEAAMTFSVGFLGPQLSEMLSEYAQYLEANEELNERFLGKNLDIDSAGFTIGQNTKDTIKGDMISSLQSESFNIWLASYFSATTHEELESTPPNTSDKLLMDLKNGSDLYLKNHIKLAIIQSENGDYDIAIYGESISISKSQKHIIDKLNGNQKIIYQDIEESNNQTESIALIIRLYENNTLSLRNIN